MGTVAFMDLPECVHELIADAIVQDTRAFVPPCYFLQPLARTSRYMRGIVRPLLFRRLWLSGRRQIMQLHAHFDAEPAAAAWVREVRCTDLCLRTREDLAAFAGLLLRLPRVRSVSLAWLAVRSADVERRLHAFIAGQGELLGRLAHFEPYSLRGAQLLLPMMQGLQTLSLSQFHGTERVYEDKPPDADAVSGKPLAPLHGCALPAALVLRALRPNTLRKVHHWIRRQGTQLRTLVLLDMDLSNALLESIVVGAPGLETLQISRCEETEDCSRALCELIPRMRHLRTYSGSSVLGRPDWTLRNP